jgi:hypothetical protein
MQPDLRILPMGRRLFLCRSLNFCAFLHSCGAMGMARAASCGLIRSCICRSLAGASREMSKFLTALDGTCRPIGDLRAWQGSCMDRCRTCSGGLISASRFSRARCTTRKAVLCDSKDRSFESGHLHAAQVPDTGGRIVKGMLK